MELREFGGGERWSEHGSRERLALKFFLAKVIAIATPDASTLPAYYLRFARDLTPNDVVVTFNWDVLLEKVLRHVGTEYSYTGEADKILILKLHGSLNWISGEPRAMAPHARSFAYRPIGYAGGPWSCPYQTGHVAVDADFSAMNSRGERMRKPL